MVKGYENFFYCHFFLILNFNFLYSNSFEALNLEYNNILESYYSGDNNNKLVLKGQSDYINFYIDEFKTLYKKLESFNDIRKNYLTSIVNFQIASLVQSINIQQNSFDSYSIFLNTKSVILDFISFQFFKDCQKSFKSDAYRIIPNREAIAPKVRVEVEPMDNINVAAIIPKPDKNLENSSSNTTIGVGIFPIKTQEELSKKTLPSKLEDLKSFLKTTCEKEAFKEANDTQDKINNSNIGEGIVNFHKEYENLSSLFWDMQNKFHTQKDLLRKDIDFKKDIEKHKVMSRSFSYIETKIKDLHLKLNEIQSNFQIADGHWGNANFLLRESTEKLIRSIEKRYDNESRKQSQIGGSANWRDINWADNFAKDAKQNAVDSMNNLVESAAHYFQHSCSGKKRRNSKKILTNGYLISNILSLIHITSSLIALCKNGKFASCCC